MRFILFGFKCNDIGPDTINKNTFSKSAIKTMRQSRPGLRQKVSRLRQNDLP